MQFKQVQSDFKHQCELGHWRELNEKTREELARLFSQFASEFEKQFGVSLIEAERAIQPTSEIKGAALEALKGWSAYLNRHAATPYREWLEFYG